MTEINLNTPDSNANGREPVPASDPASALSDDSRVIHAILKLSRAMRRCPPDPGKLPFPPAVGRLLECVSAHDGISSRELCEILDLRPSSLSELLARTEQKGWLIRTPDPADRRVQRLSLSEAGAARIAELKAAREAEAARKTACLSPAEKARFAELCDRLAEHMATLAPEQRCAPGRGHRGPHGPFEPMTPRDRREPEEESFDLPEAPPAGAPEGRCPGRPGKPHFPPDTRFRC